MHDLAFALSRAFFVSERLKDGELPKDSSSSMGVLTSSGITGSFPLLQVIGLDRHLVHLFQNCGFSPSGLAASHSLAAIVRRDLVSPSFALLAPLVFFPCHDANGGIDILAIGSSDWLAL